MVSKVEEALKQQQKQAKGKSELYQQRMQKQIQYINKGNVSKFKRSTSTLEEDGASSAILLLACIACSH